MNEPFDASVTRDFAVLHIIRPVKDWRERAGEGSVVDAKVGSHAEPGGLGFGGGNGRYHFKYLLWSILGQQRP